MKCSINKTFGAYDTGPDFTLKLKPLMLGFNDVVEAHSKQSGCGIDVLLARKKAWVLHRMFIRIHDMPRMGDELRVVSWHKGSRGYKGFRDYEVCLDSKKMISASSSWLFLDLERNRLLKAPKESSDWYTVETDNATDYDIDEFIPVPKLNCEEYDAMTTRSSDLDPIGHVNNAVYLDFLETSINRKWGAGCSIDTVMIQFHKEITKDVAQISVGISQNEAGRRFTIESDAGIHAFGDFTLKKQAKEQNHGKVKRFLGYSGSG